MNMNTYCTRCMVFVYSVNYNNDISNKKKETGNRIIDTTFLVRMLCTCTIMIQWMIYTKYM